MALVRCACVATLDSENRLEVTLPDPDCGYVIHRLEALVAAEPEPA